MSAFPSFSESCVVLAGIIVRKVRCAVGLHAHTTIRRTTDTQTSCQCQQWIETCLHCRSIRRLYGRDCGGVPYVPPRTWEKRAA